MGGKYCVLGLLHSTLMLHFGRKGRKSVLEERYIKRSDRDDNPGGHAQALTRLGAFEGNVNGGLCHVLQEYDCEFNRSYAACEIPYRYLNSDA